MNHIVESVSYFMNPWSELKTNLEVLILLKSVCRALVSWGMNFVLKTELGAAKNATIIAILRVAKNCGLLNWLKMSYKVIHTSRSVFLNADPKRMGCDCWLWPIVTALSDGKIFFALYGNHNLIDWRNYNYQSECLVYNICSYQTIFIIDDLLNTEFNTFNKRPWQAHMAFLKMANLVFPVSICLGLGLYAELFLFRGCWDGEEKESFLR